MAEQLSEPRLWTPENASWAEWIALLPESERDRALSELAPTDTDLRALEYTWEFWARPKQLPPPGDWHIWLNRSGRGAGKTRTGAEWVIYRAQHGPFKPIALVGQTKADVRDTMIEVGESSILKCSPPWFTPRYEPSKRRLSWPNGVVATVFSGDEPDQLRGPQHATAWVDELAKFRYPTETWDMLMLGLRLSDDPRAIVTTTPRPIKVIRDLLADPNTVDVVGSTYENMSNLSPVFINQVIRKYEGTRLGQQELYGALLDDVPGALWKRSTLEEHRRREHPDLVRVVVAVDPAVSSGEESNEHGIIVAGIDRMRHGWVLEDCTLRGSPGEWARQAVGAYHRWQADCIIAENNQGGDMVRYTLETIDRTAPVKMVHASRGKMTRAEPISALYEKGEVHHVGMFADLEDQLCTWVPGEDSPDRLDALVWAMTDLLIGDEPMTFIQRYR